MATNNTRDVKMQLSVETLGQENIRKLGDEVRKLAKDGGDAAPEFARLADEIDRLEAQAAALRSFELLSDQTAALAAAQERAALTATEMRTRMEGLNAVTLEAKRVREVASKEVAAARDAYDTATAALKRLNIETQGAARKEQAYLDQKKALSLAALDQQEKLKVLNKELEAASAALRTAELAEKGFANELRRTTQESVKTENAVKAHTDAVEQAEQAALALGVATDNVAAAQAEIAQALNKAGTEATTARERIERLAQQQKDLVEIRAFQKLADDAQHLARATDYLNFFDDALGRVATGQKAAAQAAADARWQQEAFEIVEAAEAAQKLARETEVAAAALRELAAIDAFEKQAQASKDLAQATDYVNFWTTALKRAEDQEKETAIAATQSAARISDAFRTIGQRGAAELEAEIRKVKTSLEIIQREANVTGGALSSAFASGQGRIRELERELRAVNGQLTSGDRLAGLFKNSLGQITAGNIIADGVGYLVNKVKEMGVAMIAAIVQLDQLRRGLTAVYGSALTAAQQIIFLRNTANAAGVSMGAISQAFVRFTAATKASNIGLDTTNELFAAVTRAASTLGLGGEQVSGMLEALGQMASKGTVSMEELRQQLGDRLPGALSLVAKGLGLSEAALIKLVESGGLAARDLFPALTKALNEMKGSAEGLVPTWERLKNVMTEAAQNAGDAGWVDVLTGALKLLAFVLGTVILVVTAASEAVFGFVKAVTAAANPTLTWAEKLTIWKEIAGEAAQRQEALTNSIRGTIAGTQTATQVQTAHTVAMLDAGTKAAALTLAHNTTAKAQEAQAFASKVLADKTLDLSSKVVQIKSNIDSLLDAQKKDTESKTKLIQAAKLEGDALIDLAKLRGQEYEVIEASTAAQVRNVAAISAQAEAQRTETELLELKLDTVKRVAAMEKDGEKIRKQEIEDIEKKVGVSRAETEQSKQAEAAARAELTTRQLQSKAYRDNSASLAEYAKALNAAQQAVRELERLHAQGKVSDERLMEARRRLTETQYLFNDALKDTITKLDQENRMKQATISVAQAKLVVEQQSLLSMAAMQRAAGNELAAIELEIMAKRKQIEITRLSAQAKKAEADATIAAANAELAALKVDDAMYESKRKEILIRLENAKVKQIEAGAAEIVIRGIEREIDALRLQVSLRDTSSQAVDRDTASRDRNTSSINRQTEALERQERTNDGFEKNKDGSAKGTFTNNLPVDQAFALANGQKMTQEQAAAAFQQAQNAYNDMQALLKLQPGAASPEYIQSTTALFNAARAAYEKLNAPKLQGNAPRLPGLGSGTTPAGAETAPVASTATSATKTIRFESGGQAVNASFGSAADAAQFERMLQAVATGKASAQ